MNINHKEPSSTILSNTNSSDDGQRKPKRKKTSRACNHCHKTHMTCDSGRPCKRCIQKGLQATCEDAPRKRKKYLEDVPNSSLLTSRSMNSVNLSFISTSQPPETPELKQEQLQPLQLPQQPQPQPQQQTPQARIQMPIQTGPHIELQNSVTDESSATPVAHPPAGLANYSANHKTYQATMFQHSSTTPNLMPSVSEYFPELYNQQFQPPEHPNQKRRTNFLSSAADLEYATLSSILHETFGHHTTSNEGTPNSHNFSPALSPHNMTTNGAPPPPTIGPPSSVPPSHGQGHQLPSTITAADQLQDPGKLDPSHSNHILTNHTTPSPLNPTRSHIYEDTRYPKCDETINQYFLGETESGHVALFPDVLTAIMTMKNNDPAVYIERNSKLELSFTIGILHEDSANGHSREDTLFKEPEEIYAKVNKPFSYTPGYHSLIAYLRKRFDKPMLVKMAESMATYRPSFIACTNSLKEHDLIFMEQCFQRTLLTYDNIIKLSGTPTIVWRRTGEIAYVGNEFCILTGWTKEELVGKGKRKFIVELLDDKSVLEYFQVFSRIAFGDFLGATMTECTLLTPNPEVKIRTGCMWTLKRDVFGIPMMIVGNFLPIL
ncbi:Transcription activator of gluconeogenesis ERT1 [Candida viswanathii]|uniref:Transcription activator of gluconeogenesis ERT1 n=1 Tax=Candida viswanathii TaxID=5486 RepID=A0A367Y0Y1_9ASCO|nr:Transcription activator of gluconeogenesis ERT1 [Candida viswanathii]